MGRNHIHFAIGEIGAEGVISGMRSSAQVLVYLDVAKAILDNVPLFLSSNSVVLSPGIGSTGAIPPKYFLSVVRASDKKPFDPSFTTNPPKAYNPNFSLSSTSPVLSSSSSSSPPKPSSSSTSSQIKAQKLSDNDFPALGQ